MTFRMESRMFSEATMSPTVLRSMSRMGTRMGINEASALGSLAFSSSSSVTSLSSSGM